MRTNGIKRILARVLDAGGICTLGMRLQRSIYGPHIRAVNYHAVLTKDVNNFEAQLRWYATKFESVSHEELAAFLKDGTWRNERPGLIISFDDGLRSHAEIAAAVLEKHGFVGWFFVPSQAAELDEEQVINLIPKHVIGSHTRTHCRMNDTVASDTIADEIEGSRADLENILKADIDAFAWVGGEEGSYSREAAAAIRKAYKIAFMTNSDVITPGTNAYQLQRSNVEADYPLWLVRFQLSGLMDIFYYFKRRRVNRLTA